MSDGDILGRIKAEYEEKKNRAANDRKNRIESVRADFPRIREIDREIARLGAENIGKIAADPENAQMYNSQLKAKYDILYKEKADIIKANGIDPGYEKYRYSCPICSDTGYAPSGGRCKCFEQELINEIFEMRELIKSLKYENFDTFSFDYYSSAVNSGGVNELENIVRIVKRAKRLCENFDDESRGLMFIGDVGLGKTFLSKCITKELIKRGKTVVNVRAVKLFRMLEDNKFGRDNSGYKTDYIYSADLLIIDDLGTETKSQINTAFLDEIINERADMGKKMVISSNLSMDELHKMYSKRFVSRIMENFILCKFYGEDIRKQKI